MRRDAQKAGVTRRNTARRTSNLPPPAAAAAIISACQRRGLAWLQGEISRLIRTCSRWEPVTTRPPDKDRKIARHRRRCNNQSSWLLLSQNCCRVWLLSTETFFSTCKIHFYLWSLTLDIGSICFSMQPPHCQSLLKSPSIIWFWYRQPQPTRTCAFPSRSELEVSARVCDNICDCVKLFNSTLVHDTVKIKSTNEAFKKNLELCNNNSNLRNLWTH